MVDGIDAAARRACLYSLGEAPAPARAKARTLRDTTEAVHQAVCRLRSMKRPHELIKQYVRINQLENEGDDSFRSGLSALLAGERDLRCVLMWKDVYEHVEKAIDRCEDVAGVLEGIALEHA